MLFEGTLQADGTLKVVLNRQNEYFAARSAVARARGTTGARRSAQFTKVKDSSEPFHFRFADIDGKVYSRLRLAIQR